ncbi:hypothetical protein DH2020_020535 [Rehmannia glutinosa]|uniref:Annexin n=1 Tax=Rehmannia glutinosa TaxID=99300 RepID=A0ABR0WIH3_REHGL
MATLTIPPVLTSPRDDATQLYQEEDEYTDGTVERLFGSPHVPPSPEDPTTGVSSKDTTISPLISARLYIPKLTHPTQTLPILVYYHCGGFCLESAFSFLHHRYINLLSAASGALVISVEYRLAPEHPLSAASGALVISVEYRLAPEHPLPAAYDDSWEALKWVCSHADLNQIHFEKDQWIANHGDFNRVYIGGDSAGANIAHNIALRVGSEPLPEKVKKSGWKGEVEVVEVEGEDHCFHIYDTETEKARNLIKRFGCDTAAVVNILAHRDATQRSLIAQEYRAMYSEDLSKRLASELRGDVERAILLWMPDPAVRDATIVRQALSGDFISLKAATELLLACVSAIRYEGPEVDRAMAELDAKSLYKAGEKRLGTDEKTFIRIFSERSCAHLAAVAAAYRSMYGKSLKKAIKSETSGNFEFGLLTILRCAENPAKYFAKVLHKAMKGMGTNDSALIRVIVTRAEIDMQYIKAEYQKKYGKTLNDAVRSETSSHYRTFLLALLGAS